MNTNILHEIEHRGIKLPLDRDLSHLGWETKKMEKLERQLTRMRTLRDDQGRLHPRYLQTKTGRLYCRNPSILVLPPDLFWNEETDLLDVSISSLEVLMAAKVQGQDDLVALLDGKRHFADILREVVPEFAQIDRTDFKMAIYRGIYGAKPESKAEERAKGAIARKYSRLFPLDRAFGGKAQCDELVGRIHRTNTKLMLAVGALADKMPGCRVVGMHYDQPLVEYTGDDPEGTKTRIQDLTYGLLRAWTGEPSDPIQSLRVV